MRLPRTRHISKMLAAGLVVGTMTTGSYAFTNTNTVQISDAGQGANVISGYTVGDVKYTESTLNPHTVASVSFTLAPKDGGGAPTAVKVSLQNADDVVGASAQTWYSCNLDSTTVTATNDWLCSTGAAAPQFSSIDELDVVAHD